MIAPLLSLIDIAPLTCRLAAWTIRTCFHHVLHPKHALREDLNWSDRFAR